MRYRRKPTEIEAVQFQGEDDGEWQWSDTPLWFKRALIDGDLSLVDEVRGPTRQPARVRMRTIHGDEAYARPNDWIVPERRTGRFYPVDPDIFASTYEPAEENA